MLTARDSSRSTAVIFTRSMAALFSSTASSSRASISSVETANMANPKKKRTALLPLSARQREVLDILVGYKGWARPMDIGARDGSHHSATLSGLAKRALVERKKLHAIYCYNGSTHRKKLVDNRWVYTDGHPPHPGCCCKGSCRYRITSVGRHKLRSRRA